ncbi:anti-sigma factor [Beggiatoa alba]|nr:anti-sigma factor [Beggiatoa alba]
MKMQSETLREQLAAEYVLGTLVGAARKRFEYYLQQDPALQAWVLKWGQVLHPMSGFVKPIRPPRRVWESIEQRLQFKKVPSGFWNSLAVWRWLSILSATLAVVVGLYLGQFIPVQKIETAPNYLAVIENSQSQGAWLISTDIHQKRLTVRNLKAQQLASNQDFELWLLPPSPAKQNFQAPVSVGLIHATKQTEIRLSSKVLALIHQTTGVAVSLEPRGGSPSGLPTGPVLYQGKLQRL